MGTRRNVAFVWTMKIKNKLYHPLVTALNNVIAAAKTARLYETVVLLKAARLDLLTRIQGIEENELEALSLTLVRGSCAEEPAKPKTTRARVTPRKKPRAKLN
jgi:hypothetical protein